MELKWRTPFEGSRVVWSECLQAVICAQDTLSGGKCYHVYDCRFEELDRVGLPKTLGVYMDLATSLEEAKREAASLLSWKLQYLTLWIGVSARNSKETVHRYFPKHCRTCEAALVEPGTRLVLETQLVQYECGGAYRPTQNGELIDWKGRCPRVERCDLLGLPYRTPLSIIRDGMMDLGLLQPGEW